MRAVLCKSFTGPGDLAIEEVAPPAPAADEVRLEVHAASVTFMDNLIVSGLYQMKPPLPFVAGTDAAGEVVEVGSEVEHLEPGDRVAAFHWTGGFAEQMVAKGWRAARLPDGVDYVVGSAVLHTYVTSLYSLRIRGRLIAGETLVVHGAAGGVGLAAVDVGRHMGARIIATVGSGAKAELVRSYGAEHVIDYTDESIRDRVREITGGKGADVIFDLVGGDAFDQSIRCIAWDGRILVVGFTSGRIPELPLNLPLLKNCSIVGVFTGAWADRYPQANLALSEEILALVAEGKLKPHISQVLPLEKVGEALDAIAQRTATGRIVLKVR
jgi:NADPH2:quinone reductase